MNNAGRLTVVFTYKDASTFKRKRDRLFELLQSYDVNEPPEWGITAISNDDEIHRVSLIEGAVSDGDFSRVDELLSCVNLRTFLRNIKQGGGHETGC
ncbi:hypothetical protein C9J12_21300 [Photobacterium frigidiphilum]|uniref:Uncharacterized protein n=1 Tax=Photobacterium frigidiphilum TaxID=264736 RepID=A0A2T3JAA7_9GAMM|nr:hypothetical protein [Photobacterium frigidiphilum]PSU45778.1 hypothetical protein C9J12_21300 [Photobacterium frigidiphilum]